MADRYGMIKVPEDEYNKLKAIRNSLETLTEKCYGDGPFVITIQFENDNDEHYDHLWIESHITRQGDPMDYLAEFVGEASSIEEAIISIVDVIGGE
jgi:hypothetical protein